MTVTSMTVVSISAPAQAAPGQSGAKAIWSSTGTQTSGCPSSLHVLVPNQTADYFAGHPEDLVVPGAFHAGGAATSRLLKDAAARQLHWLSSVQCRPGRHGSPVPTRTVSNTVHSANWSGYVTGSGSGYIGAAMEWPIHAVSTGNESDSYSSTWPGIGSGNNQDDALIQAGMQQEAICLSSCASFNTPWFEIYPQEDEQVITNFTVHTADLMGVLVEYDPDTAQAYFELDDLTAGFGVYLYQDVSPNAQGFTGTGSQAEWIVERPTVCGLTCQKASLPNFGTEPIVGAQAAQGDWDQPTYSNMGDRSPVEYDMYSCNGKTLLASPTAPTSTTDFTVQWHHQGIAESC